MTKAKETVARYAAQAREELAESARMPVGRRWPTLVEYTVNRHG